MKKIIFIAPSIFFQRDYHRFGAEYFVGKGYAVEIWRMIPDKAGDFVGSAPLYQGDNYYEYNYREIIRQVESHLNDLYVFFHLESKVYHAISKRGCKYILVTGMGGVFLRSVKSEAKEKFSLIGKMKRAFQRGVFKSGVILYNRLLINDMARKTKKMQRENPPIQIMTSTHKVAKIYLSDEQLQGNVLYTHAMDYDRYIEENRKNDDDAKKYIVFCDCGLGTIDYDSVLNKYEQLEDKSRFSAQIEEVLSKLEEKYNLPAIILGHPHTKYETDMIYGRKNVLNKTIDFTKKAAVFVLNTSSAISFAALYDVPTLQVVNHEFRKLKYFYPNLYEHIKYEAKNVYGCGFLDMDDEESMTHPWNYVRRMDTMKREQYIRDYLIDNDTTNKCSYEYLEEAIRLICCEE